MGIRKNPARGFPFHLNAEHAIILDALPGSPPRVRMAQDGNAVWLRVEG
jgi:hypothetical protein